MEAGAVFGTQHIVLSSGMGVMQHSGLHPASHTASWVAFRWLVEAKVRRNRPEFGEFRLAIRRNWHVSSRLRPIRGEFGPIGPRLARFRPDPAETQASPTEVALMLAPESRPTWGDIVRS